LDAQENRPQPLTTQPVSRGTLDAIPTPEDIAAAQKKSAAAKQPSVAEIRAVWATMPGKKAVITPEANGCRPVVVYLPPGFDPAKPARLITAIHGHYGNVGAHLQKHGWLDRIRSLTEPEATPTPTDGLKPDSQIIYVLPQANQPPFTYWMNPPESAAGLEKAALDAARLMAVGHEIDVVSRTVEAHSGAGIALANAVAQGELHADKINMLDATYGTWGARCVDYVIAERARGHDVHLESWYTRHQEMKQHNDDMIAQAQQADLDGDVVKTHDVTAETHDGVPPRHMGTP